MTAGILRKTIENIRSLMPNNEKAKCMYQTLLAQNPNLKLIVGKNAEGEEFLLPGQYASIRTTKPSLYTADGYIVTHNALLELMEISENALNAAERDVEQAIKERNDAFAKLSELETELALAKQKKTWWQKLFG